MIRGSACLAVISDLPAFFDWAEELGAEEGRRTESKIKRPWQVATAKGDHKSIKDLIEASFPSRLQTAVLRGTTRRAPIDFIGLASLALHDLLDGN